jgi:class 3 adenylate cyclase
LINNDKKKNKVVYETKILDNSITKIGSLLLLGFGEAGTSLLSEMMGRDGDIDTMEAGKKTIGIFGFWDIRQFTDTTEILEENVMMFVNEIAQMVHGETHEYLGDPNKNIGDAFLLVWKFPQSEVYTGLNGDLCFSKDSYLINNYAESALIAILKIIYKMSRDQRIVAYSENAKLIAKMPDYRVKMGFGLHWGWCIEGAIGSSYKIDATYLSHHVNYASTLEEKTKEYGVLLAISHQFYEICSNKAKKYFRQIDWYKPNRSRDVKNVYTVDVETSLINPDRDAVVLTGKQHYQEKINRRLDNLVQTKDPNFKMAIRLRQDPELIALLKHVPKKILAYYKKMFQHYTKGEWRKAKSGLNKIIKRKKDGPSLFLLNIMKESNYKPPKNWNGVREITT